jgi:hypothetical protein
MATATNTGTAATTASGGEALSVPCEAASTNVYWTFAGRESKEVFNLQTTLRGSLSKKQIEEHVKSVLAGLGIIHGIGGHAKPVGQQPASDAPSNGAANGKQRGNGLNWGKGAKGRNILILRDGQDIPDKVECPVHDGKQMRKQSRDGDTWFSHKQGSEWCSAGVEYQD